uniref:DNA excision repair protein ERCC-6 n=1 Tax=Phallusia mammillata TaxID=59560 RepID=A0A6F9DC23_9ASCI|nr:DNA excision repair protein ERCC-6 [Phallusia mammillata]
MADINEESVLQIEGVNVYNAETLEKDVIETINRNIQEKEERELEKKTNEVTKQIGSVQSLLRQNESALKFFTDKSQAVSNSHKINVLKIQQEKYKTQLGSLNTKLLKLNHKLADVTSGHSTSNHSHPRPPVTYDKSTLSTAKSLKQRKELIKKGLATPFSLQTAIPLKTTPAKLKPAVKLDDAFGSFLSSGLLGTANHKQKEQVSIDETLNERSCPKSNSPVQKRKAQFVPPVNVDNSITKHRRKQSESDEDYKVPSSDEVGIEDSDEYELEREIEKEKSHKHTGRKHIAHSGRKVCDDANPKMYKKRIIRYKQTLLREEADGFVQPDNKHLEGGLKVTGKVWKKLYKYQQTGVKWLWELHSQQAGGILGDEMGLGKTIQVIAFLDALRNSKIRDRDSSFSYDGLGPVLIVSPTTVMHQWVREIHLWAPLLRVAVLHNSGSYKGAKADLIHNIALSRGVLITSYERMRISLDALLTQNWHYVVLDEGHKIRNPEAAITHAVKMFQTPHRIILSGSPIQNHLRELWSLFDFIFPGKLGTLQCFMEQFSVPIVQGGYANATEVQVQTAYKCACVLRDTIAPYLLRRMKVDVQCHINLPKKNDHVLFCSLTDEQVEIYKKYLDSETVYSILCRNMKIFVGLIQLRKICNHPDLYTGGTKLLVGEQEPPLDSERRFGFWKKSGKMIVIDSLLRIWKKQNKKVLLFTQSKLMLNVLEDFVKLRKYSYMTMHGGTTVSSRQPLVKAFNEDPSIFVFILTTRVGGLGVNLVGADRVVIFDPDWNPSTDAQAQERSWRIGQDKEVTIYRLITTGTIEEKIYHRQIFKQFMSNRVLKDPKQRRFFKTNDMHELFTLQHQPRDGSKTMTETASIFAGTGSEIKLRKLKAKMKAKRALERAQRHKDVTENVDSVAKYVDNVHDQTDPNSSNNEVMQYSEPHTSSTTTHSDITNDDVTRAASNDVITQAESRVDDLSNSTTDSMQNIYCDVTHSQQSDNRDCDVTPPSHDVDVDSGGSKKIKESFLKVLRKFQESKQNSAHDVTSDRKKRGNRNRNRKLYDVEGEVIDYVTKKSRYKPRSEEETSRKNSDEYVLTKLFKKGVHTAMEHSTIMNSSTPDYALVESEANRVAKEAIKNLKLSRKHYRYPGSKPAQKPRFGKKQPEKKKIVETKDESSEDETPMGAGNVFGNPGAGTSSSNILKQIMMRTHKEDKDAAEDSESDEDENLHLLPSDDEDISIDDKLLREIVQFLIQECHGEATTDELMSKFKGHVEVKQAPKFKAMLLRVCEKLKSETGTRWRLKPDFY